MFCKTPGCEVEVIGSEYCLDHSEEMRRRITEMLGFNKKKESEMEDVLSKNESNLKKSTDGFLSFVKDGVARVGRFVKRHAAKSFIGLASLTLGGLFTSSFLGAMFIGSFAYASIAIAMKLIQNKRKKAEANRVSLVLEALGESTLYTSVGGMSLFCLFGLSVVLLGSLFFSSYAAYAYMGYFILV